MADDSDPIRDGLHEFMQQQGPPHQAIGDGALLTGWILVSEWMDPEGEKHIVRGYSASLPAWTAKGLLHEALFGEWPDDDDGD